MIGGVALGDKSRNILQEPRNNRITANNLRAEWRLLQNLSSKSVGQNAQCALRRLHSLNEHGLRALSTHSRILTALPVGAEIPSLRTAFSRAKKNPSIHR